MSEKCDPAESCQTCSQSPSRSAEEKAAIEMRLPFLGRVPIDPNVVVDCDNGVPVLIAHPHSPVAEEFQKIVRSCRAHLEHRREFKGVHKPQIGETQVKQG